MESVSTPYEKELKMCCGTTCDKNVISETVKDLEVELEKYKMEIERLKRLLEDQALLLKIQDNALDSLWELVNDES